MRILQILAGTELNGAVGYALNISELLAERGHEIVLLRRPQLDRSVPSVGNIKRVDSSLKRTVAEVRRIGAFCADQKIDVIHTHMSSAHAFGALLRIFYRVPCVATAHKLNLQLHWAFNDRVLCHNDESMRYMRRINWVPPSRLRLVRPFIDERETGWAREPRAETLARFGLPQDRPMMITVGNFISRKGLIDIVEALPGVIAAGHDPSVVFCGWGGDQPYVDEVKGRIQTLGLGSRVNWLSRVSHEDRVHLTRAADLFVQASRVETGPLSALEGMAHGLPVVGTRCGTMADFVIPGETGALVPIARPDEMADAIIASLSDPTAMKRMGQAGLARFNALFTATGNIGLIETAYAEAHAGLRS
jgi:glycosyltransferase involved in cell wall biosynthesis